jgi:hypothetical protein
MHMYGITHREVHREVQHLLLTVCYQPHNNPWLCFVLQVAFDVCPHRYAPDPSHVPKEGEQQRMLDIQECFKIPTVSGRLGSSI